MKANQSDTFLNIPELSIFYCGTAENIVKSEIFSQHSAIHYYATSNLTLDDIQPTFVQYFTLDPNYVEDESSSLNNSES